MGFCGLRRNESGRLISLSTAEQGVYYAYDDPHITNCCATLFCPAGTGFRYPRFAYERGPELGYENLAIFLHGCNFNCLYCQNLSHKKIAKAPVHSVDELVKRTLANPRISCWCFFGGSPEPQLPFAINASQKALAALKGRRMLRICFEWNGCGHPELVRRAARMAHESGGNVKFDLKALDDNLSLALSGTSSRLAYENFERVATEFRSTGDHPPSLYATTLLVPGYVDEEEFVGIAKFIADIDSGIPYSLPSLLMKTAGGRFRQARSTRQFHSQKVQCRSIRWSSSTLTSRKFTYGVSNPSSLTEQEESNPSDLQTLWRGFRAPPIASLPRLRSAQNLSQSFRRSGR